MQNQNTLSGYVFEKPAEPILKGIRHGDISVAYKF